MDITKFRCKQILSTNTSQKRLVLLGTIQASKKQQECIETTNPKSQPQAILLINPKLPPTSLGAHKFAHLFPPQVTQIFQNDIYTRYEVVIPGQYQIQAIYPCNQKHKSKYREKKMEMLMETAQEYFQSQAAVMDKEGKHLEWVWNILEGKAEADRVMYRDESVVILPDFKYSDLKQVENLHLLAVFTDRSLHTIRNLTGTHLPILKKCQQNISQTLKNYFNLPLSSCRCFFHYLPTFYQLHIHINYLGSHVANALVDRAHILDAVINNLQICADYYRKVKMVKVVECKETQKEKLKIQHD